MTVELVAEPIVGYRFWNVDTDGYLVSVSSREERKPGWRRPVRWETRDITARCLDLTLPPEVRDSHVSPLRNCRCGVYAEARPMRLRKGWRDVTPEKQSYYGMSWSIVYGTVLLWGHVVVHRNGYRARHARICSIIGGNERLEGLAEFYGVPTTEEWE